MVLDLLLKVLELDEYWGLVGLSVDDCAEAGVVVGLVVVGRIFGIGGLEVGIDGRRGMTGTFD